MLESPATLLQSLYILKKTSELHGFMNALGSHILHRVPVRNMNNPLLCTCSLSELFSDPELPSLNIYKVLFISMKENVSAPLCLAYGSSMR